MERFCDHLQNIIIWYKYISIFGVNILHSMKGIDSLYQMSSWWWWLDAHPPLMNFIGSISRRIIVTVFHSNKWTKRWIFPRR